MNNNLKKLNTMTDWKILLDKRIKPDLVVPYDDYFIGILPLLEFLLGDLEKYLDREGRYFGIMVKYVHRSRDIIKNLGLTYESDIWKRIIFLYKPVIVKEYKKLLKRKVSKADSIICIFRRFLEILLLYSDGDENYERLNQMRGIFDKMYSNIKNKGKEYSFPTLDAVVSGSIEEGIVGLHKLGKFSIFGDEKKRKSKEEFSGSGLRIEEVSDNLVTSVSWTDE